MATNNASLGDEESLKDQIISIKIYTENNPIEVIIEKSTTVEDVILELCKKLNIKPLMKTLYAIKVEKANKVYRWLNNCEYILNIDFNEKYQLIFRIRYKMNSILDLKRLDMNTYNYYFHQVKDDVKKSDGIYENRSIHLNKVLGLVVADMYRDMLEKNKGSNDVMNEYRTFIPNRSLNFISQFISKSSIKNSLNHLVKSNEDDHRINAEYVKQCYLEQFENLFPTYLSEDYKVTIEDSSGKTRHNANLRVNVYCEDYPGLSVKYDETSEKIESLCSIEDLCFISKRYDNSIEIARKNGIPIYLKMKSNHDVDSFISLLDGYYRLMEKWTFNLCKDLPSPSLLRLNNLKCHGPICGEFSYSKLQEKRNCAKGCYILRESDTVYGEYYLDVCCQQRSTPKTFKITKNDDDLYVIQFGRQLERILEITPAQSITKLLANLRLSRDSLDVVIPIEECLPPSEYDQSNLLLCKKKDTNTAISIGLPVIQLEHLRKFEDKKKLSRGNKTEVYPGEWRVKTKINVYIKQLTSMQDDLIEWLELTNKWCVLDSSAIVKTLGVTLYPVSMICEASPFGPLDSYLRDQVKKVQEIELVQAAANLSSALWYLKEKNIYHGNIRCHNLFVFSHTENGFLVKLSDPGLKKSFNYDEIPFLPPENQTLLNRIRKSFWSDIWACGTTLWQIFSYGVYPDIYNIPYIKQFYEQNRILPEPRNLSSDMSSNISEMMYSIMKECWNMDPQKRKSPQAIMRDCNQIFYSSRTEKHVYESAELCQIGSNGSISSEDTFSYSDITETTTLRNSETNYDIHSFDIDLRHDTISIESIYDLDQSYSVVLGDCIGQGFYGEVYKGVLHKKDGINERGQDVALKRLKYENTNVKQDFEREVDIMKSLEHKNVVTMIGVIKEPEFALVMEFVTHGSLPSYINIYRDRLTFKQLKKFSLDIAEGMKYLGEKNIVHRDLAARNILVADSDLVKISDFGLAQYLGNEGLYKLQTLRGLPIQWYAPEAIKGIFTRQSDVWSYGVTLYEIFSYGKSPELIKDGNPAKLEYQTKLLKALENGHRLPCPDDCPAQIYSSVIFPCWAFDPERRPTFTDIIKNMPE